MSKYAFTPHIEDCPHIGEMRGWLELQMQENAAKKIQGRRAKTTRKRWRPFFTRRQAA